MLGPEGFFASAGLLVLPFLILYVLIRLLPPWLDAAAPAEEVS